MLARDARKIQRPIADQQRKIRQQTEIIARQRLELRFQSAFGQQHTQQLDTGERRRVAEDLPRFLERPAVRQQHALHLAQRGNRNAVQHVVALGK